MDEGNTLMRYEATHSKSPVRTPMGPEGRYKVVGVRTPMGYGKKLRPKLAKEECLLKESVQSTPE